MEDEKAVEALHDDAKTENPQKKNYLRDFFQLVRFGMVGLLNTAVYYGIYYLLLQLGVNFVIATTAGTAAGITNSFIWNKLFVFKTSKSINAGEIIKFCVIYAVQYLCNLTLIFVFVTYIELSAEFSGLVAAAFCAAISYLGLRFWGFRKAITEK